jgi:lipopolysaccharide/colanic/teichoic acid biosynthesis glycosyltransferase
VDFYNQYGKRVLDVTLILILLLFIVLCGCFIMIGYFILFEFPILYKSVRIGKNGKQFSMYKCRTLAVNEDLMLEKRKFGWGNFLRLTNLDELPQLWNVLKGEMSLVGPRPLPVEYASLFTEEQNIRHTVLPGITGWAQVSGKNDIAWKRKFELDVFYVNNLSFKLDVEILVKTMLLLFNFRKDTSLSEEKFIG